MSRLGGIFWFILVVGSAMTNFIVKQTVQGLDDQLTAVRHKTVAEQKAIHELTADWTFLNQPELLANLNNRYVHLAPVSPKQVAASVDGIPLRPAPPPPQEVAPQIVEVMEAPAALPPAAMPSPTPQIVEVAEAPAARPPAAMPSPAPAPTRPPIVPVSASVPARPPIVPAMVSAPAHPARPASLDGLFAQITGDR